MLIVLAVLAVVAAACIRIVPAVPDGIVDADTIDVGRSRWRLAGYDSPERGQPGGTEATAHLRSLLAEGRSLGIATGFSYGRLVVHVFTRRGPLAWRMMASGHAHSTSLTGLVPVLIARIARRGVWGAGHKVISPARWRAMHPHHGGGQRQMRRPRRRELRFDYDGRKGLRLPGGFRLP